MKNPATMAANTISRVTVFSTSIAFVIHAYADQAHHTIASTSAARAKPCEARVLEDQRRDLREREDEDEVEEELEIARLALLLGRRLLVDERRDVAHAAATARSRNSTDSGEPVASSTRRSQRTDWPGAKSRSREQSAGVRAVDDPARLGLERGGELERHDRPVEIGVVVDRGDGDVDLRGPVRGAAPVRRRDSLVAGDELPPERVEIAVGVRVQPALERVHHEHPAREDEQLDRSCGTARRGSSSAPSLALSPRTCSSQSRRQASEPNRIADASVATRCVERRSHGRSSRKPRS